MSHTQKLSTNRFTLIATSNGKRPAELARLLNSIESEEHLLLVLLMQSGTPAPPTPADFRPTLRVIACERALPLSQARNRMLDHIANDAELQALARGSQLMLADDDCWYPAGFFRRPPLGDAIHIFDARDPDIDRPFATFDLRKRSAREMARWELMFYAVSIAIAVPYDLCSNRRFHEDFGLGNRISQGEESLFLFNLLTHAPTLTIQAHPEASVCHPWKLAGNSSNHESLAYFLGWCTRQGLTCVVPYYLYISIKYFVANLIRPKPLYRQISKALAIDFFRGWKNTLKIPSKTVSIPPTS